MLAFMQAVNSVRLVLGTLLDVTEDDDVEAAPELDDTAEYQLYGYLCGSSNRTVRALLGRPDADRRVASGGRARGGC